MEPLLSVTWLWPEGWSLALRSRRSGRGPWRERERLRPGAPPTPPRWPLLQLHRRGLLVTWWHVHPGQL